MTITDYLNACNANLKANRKDRAKRAFDIAYKLYTRDGADKNTFNMLYWLGNNFYHWAEGKVECSVKAEYFESRILVKQGT